MISFKASLQLVMFMLVFGPAAAPQEPTFNAQSNVVVVPTLVRDANGSVVYGLQAKDFIIEDDGVEQAPYLDEAAEAEPVSLMIAVQCGRRAWREFDRMRGLASMLEPVLSQPDTERLWFSLTASSLWRAISLTTPNSSRATSRTCRPATTARRYSTQSPIQSNCSTNNPRDASGCCC